jgi:hypothetical protein
MEGSIYVTAQKIPVAPLRAGSIRDAGELTQYMHAGKPWASHVPVDHTHTHGACRLAVD